MNRRFESAMRRIERSIEGLEKPLVCGATFHGDLRSISPTAKTRELQNLVVRLVECQQWVSSDSDQEWLNGVKSTLKARLDLVMNPQKIFDEIEV